MNVWGYEFSVVELVALSILLLTFFIQLFFYLFYFNGVLRQRMRIHKGKVRFATEASTPVSVIICAKDECDNLRKYLPSVLGQNYPVFEVIVINDGSTDDTENLLHDFCKRYPNLRTTFVPIGANNISTKKLGLTLGIKAAQYDCLLFTDADCLPADNNWIALMARNFTPDTDFILGYGAYMHAEGLVNKLIRYDTLFIALQYMGMALAGKPFMGVGRNLAYRKEVFFKQNGFASTLHLSSGDDDLMVNKAATRTNTRIEVDPQSITLSEPKGNFGEWFYQKERHLSVSNYYTPKSKIGLLIEPLSRGLFYLSFIAVLVFGNLVTLGLTAFVFMIRLTVQLIVVNTSAVHFGERRFFFTLPLFDIFLPLMSLYIMVVSKINPRRRPMYWK